MRRVLGVDTSNYTTSCALWEDGRVVQKKRLLPVREGQLGLRQSDAVFHHTQQLPPLLGELFAESPGPVEAVGVSARPRSQEGSYMPCFTVGLGTARSIAAALGDGEDYELLFTVAPERAPELEKAWPEEFAPLARIGEVMAGSGEVIAPDGSDLLKGRVIGYEH